MRMILDQQVTWLLGHEVEQAKAIHRQVDLTYTQSVLAAQIADQHALGLVVTRAEMFCRALEDPQGSGYDFTLRHGNDVIHLLAELEDPAGRLARAIDTLKSLSILDPANQTPNPFALGDFLRAFAEIFECQGEAEVAAFVPYDQVRQGFRNANAFNTSKNRVRVKIRPQTQNDVDAGFAKNYLPPEDVLGNIDRLFGYYETADISGTSTDALFAIAMFASANVGQGPGLQTVNFADVDHLPAAAAAQLTSGSAMGGFLGMIPQLHHSLPETMMALNLVPNAALNTALAQRTFYTPFLANTNAGLDPYFADWRAARFSAFSRHLPQAMPLPANPENRGVMMLIAQDQFQMPGAQSADHEIGMLVPYLLVDVPGHPNEDQINSNAHLFGCDFYNQIVQALVTGYAGPAFPLFRMAQNFLAQVFNYTPQLPDGNRRAQFNEMISRGMNLPIDRIAACANFGEISALFSPNNPQGGVLEVAI